MTTWPASDEITLAHDGHIVRLRPSLRAAARLERLHDGFDNLFRRVDEFHLGTISEIILSAATNRPDAAAFLSDIAGKPLFPFMLAVRAPVADLCRAFIPTLDKSSDKPAGKPITWAEYHRELYRTATGWLGWTPEAAWSATPTEINEAAIGKYAMLKAIHGSADEERAYDPREEVSEEQTREGINRLKALARGKA